MLNVLLTLAPGKAVRAVRATAVVPLPSYLNMIAQGTWQLKGIFNYLSQLLLSYTTFKIKIKVYLPILWSVIWKSDAKEDKLCILAPLSRAFGFSFQNPNHFIRVTRIGLVVWGTTWKCGFFELIVLLKCQCCKTASLSLYTILTWYFSICVCLCNLRRNTEHESWMILVN